MGDLNGVFETWHEMDKRGCAQDVDTCILTINGLFSYNKVEDACFQWVLVLRRWIIRMMIPWCSV